MIWRIYLLFQESFIAGDTRYHFGVSPIHADFPRKEESQNGGKTMIGIAHVMHAAGLLIPPSSATGCDRSCTVGCRNTFSPAGTAVTPYSPHRRENPAGCRVSSGNPSYGSTPPVPPTSPSLGKEPRTVRTMTTSCTSQVSPHRGM